MGVSGEDMASFMKMGVGILPFLAYGLFKFWQTFKDDKRVDNNTLRIDNFYDKIQKQCETLGLRVDELSKIRETLSDQLSSVNAQLLIAKGQVETLSKDIEARRTRERYLEDLLTKNGISYV